MCVQIQDDIADPIHVFQGKIRIQRQRQHSLADMQSNRRIFWIVLSPVAVKAAGDRIEVFSCPDAMFRQCFHDIISARPEFLFLEDDRKICIILLHAFLNHIQAKSLHAIETAAVMVHDLFPLFDLSVHMPEIADPHRCAELIHLGICADRVNGFCIADAEILQTIDLPAKLWIMEGHSAPFNRIEYFRRMKAEAAGIAEISDADAMIGFSEGMGSIIENLQSVFLSDPLNLFYVADISVDMDRYNCVH